MVLAVLAAVSCSEYQPTLPALNEDEADSKPASSTSSEEVMSYFNILFKLCNISCLYLFFCIYIFHDGVLTVR
jgi:hypothetical protein